MIWILEKSCSSLEEKTGEAGVELDELLGAGVPAALAGPLWARTAFAGSAPTLEANETTLAIKAFAFFAQSLM